MASAPREYNNKGGVTFIPSKVHTIARELLTFFTVWEWHPPSCSVRRMHRKVTVWVIHTGTIHLHAMCGSS